MSVSQYRSTLVKCFVFHVYLQPKVLYSVYLYEEIASHFSSEIMGIFIRFSCHALPEEVENFQKLSEIRL